MSKLIDALALEDIRANAESLWSEVVRRGLVTDDRILAALATRFRMPVAELATVTSDARDAVTETLARKYQIVPLTVADHTLDIATANPNDLDCERALGFATGKSIRMRLASPSAIAARIDELYQPETVFNRLIDAVGDTDLETIAEGEELADLDVGSETSSARPIIRLVDHIIAEGISQRASDIHLEMQEKGVQVTLRVDGVLRPTMLLPRAVGIPLVSRIKIMSGLDIADRLRPQDGRARVSVSGRRVDLRVSTLPASTGEKVVVRILDAGSTVLELGALGISQADLAQIQHLINLREGIILVTGPTGSGKTTTLYAALRTIQQRGVNIVTVEDPVEYKLNGIVQVQVNEKAGLTFAAALRSILRQDPDVVLVGEIRDRETAGIAIQASLTGHLVLSTLHTIDAATTVSRLLDIGIESYKLGAAIKGIVAQRLLRRLCPNCRKPHTEPLSARLRRHVPDGATLFKAAGCHECNNTGYRGRLALMEVLVADAEVERRISAGESAERIAAAAREGMAMRSLWQSGIDHVVEGNTDLDELLRVVEVPIESGPPRPTPHSVLSVPTPTPTGKAPLGSARNGRPTPAPGTLTAPVEAAFELIDDIPAAPRRSGQPTVLLVEDEQHLRHVLKEMLERDGFTVIEAADGIQALEEVDHASPDAVVLDLNLPRLDGFGVLARLRSRRPTAGLPVIVLTAATDEDNEVRVFDGGATDFLSKPFRPRALSARLRAHIKARRS
ncbi:MAG: Flp pilus assembly complex ATPase component TadA [Gemmatimonadaceae bacterium]|nr:Flp pilus assembly complex ATPase component TadA [Gemmatimonadaceae bacterium]